MLFCLFYVFCALQFRNFGKGSGFSSKPTLHRFYSPLLAYYIYFWPPSRIFRYYFVYFAIRVRFFCLKFLNLITLFFNFLFYCSTLYDSTWQCVCVGVTLFTCYQLSRSLRANYKIY